MLKSLLAVVVGGAVGCSLRWLISLRFNALFPNLPPGTLLVNLVGGFIIGAALAFFLDFRLAPNGELTTTYN